MKDITDYRLDMDDDFNVAAVARPKPLHHADGAPHSTNSSPRITLRLSEEEDERLREMAAGMTISAYVRQCVFGEAAGRRRRKSYAPVKDHVALAQLLAQLGETRLANNLNQLAYQANTGSLQVDDGVLAQLDEMYRHVTDMRDTLIRTLGLVEGA